MIRPVETVIAVACGAMGVRSLVHWIRQPVALESRAQHVWFAVFVVARAGTWWSMGVLFALYATIGATSGSLGDAVRPYAPLAVIPVILALVSFAATALLAIGGDEDLAPEGD